MNRTYTLHDDTVLSIMSLLQDEANRAEVLGDDMKKENLLADLGALENQLPQEALEYEALK